MLELIKQLFSSAYRKKEQNSAKTIPWNTLQDNILLIKGKNYENYYYVMMHVYVV